MDNRKIRDFLSRTGLGLFLVWGCVAAICLVAGSFEPLLGKVQTVLTIVALVVLTMASLWYVVVFIVTLARRQWRKAAFVFVLGLMGTGPKKSSVSPRKAVELAR